jgi:hypothetical protein
MVHSLSIFVPGYLKLLYENNETNKDEDIINIGYGIQPFRTTQFNLTDFTKLKLIGLSKKVPIEKNLVKYITIFDYDAEKLYSPRYYGEFLDDIFNTKKKWNSESTFISFIHEKLYYISLISANYYYLSLNLFEKFNNNNIEINESKTINNNDNNNKTNNKENNNDNNNNKINNFKNINNEFEFFDKKFIFNNKKNKIDQYDTINIIEYYDKFIKILTKLKVNNCDIDIIQVKNFYF